MLCPTGYSTQTSVNATTGLPIEYCANAQGYTPENIQATNDMARNRCKSQLPMLVGLGLGIFFLPGAWKIIPLVGLPFYLGISEFGGPGCGYLVRQ